MTGWFQSKTSNSSPGGKVGVTVGVAVEVGVAVIVAVAVVVAVAVASDVGVAVAVVVGVSVVVAVAVVVGVSNGVGVSVVVAVGPLSVAVGVGVFVGVAVRVVVVVAVGVAVIVPVTMAVTVLVGVSVACGSIVAETVAPAVVVAVGVGPLRSPSNSGRNAPGGNSAPAAPPFAQRALEATRKADIMPAIRPQNRRMRFAALAIEEGFSIILPLGLAPGRKHYNQVSVLLTLRRRASHHKARIYLHMGTEYLLHRSVCALRNRVAIDPYRE